MESAMGDRCNTLYEKVACADSMSSGGSGSLMTQSCGFPTGFAAPTIQTLVTCDSRSAGTLPQAPFSSKSASHATATTSYDESPCYDQTGSIILGPRSKMEALLLGLGLPKLSYRQQDDLANAKKIAMEQSIKHVLMKQALAHQQQQQKMAMYAQALSLMARVYVGSVSFELQEETIKNAFTPFGPLKSINMSWDPMTGHHKGFAFLEFETPEAAVLAQEQMNDLLLGGRNLKVGRPSNMPQAQVFVDMIKEEAKQYNRIYVASIHPDLTESDVKGVFEAFGAIRSTEFARGSLPGKHRGYAYIDFETEQAAVDAVASMNLFDLGGQFLRVGRAITPPSVRDYVPAGTHSSLPTASAVAAAAVTAKLQAIDATSSATSPFTQAPQVVVADGGVSPPTVALGRQVFVIPPPGVAVPRLPTPPSGSPLSSVGSNSPALFPNEFQQSNAVVASHQSASSSYAISAGNVPTSPSVPYSWSPSTVYGAGLPDLTTDVASKNGIGNDGKSCVIVLKNMIEPEDVDDTLEDELDEECSKYGRVDQVFIYQVPSTGAMKIFVKYSTVQEAELAQSKLHCRYFSGRQIDASFYDQNAFELKDFSR